MDTEALSPPFANVAINAFQRQQNAGNNSGKTQGSVTQNQSPLEQANSENLDSVEISDLAKAGTGPKSPGQLDERERSEVQDLKRRDQEVRSHEQAHRSAGGQHVRGATSFTYERGPDGINYAVGGEVQIDTSEIRGDPEATIRKMEQIRRAALAPNDPSPADRRVAAEASQKEAKARAELAKQQAEESKETSAGTSPEGVRDTETNSQVDNESNFGNQNIINQFIDNSREFSAPGEFLDLVA